MKIYLNKGIDKVKFMMKPAKVKKLMGKPDKEIVDPDDENELTWEYTDQKLRLVFYLNENEELGYIRSSNANLSIGDFKVIDKKVEEVMQKVDPNTAMWVKEDFFSFTTYFNEKYWLTLNVEYGRVTDIELGAPPKNEIRI